MSPEDSTAVHHRIDKLENTLTTSLGELTSAVKALVVLETEHKATRDTLSRYGQKLEKHDERLDAIEKKTPIYDLMVRVVNRVGMVAGTVIVGGIVSSYFVFS